MEEEFFGSCQLARILYPLAGHRLGLLGVCHRRGCRRGWLDSNVVQLELGTPPRYWRGEEATLVPFHNFSSSLKSLRPVFVPAKLLQCFKLICSLPLLEDLAIAHDDYDISCDEDMSNFRPSVSPVLTGTLYLCELLEYTVPYCWTYLVDHTFGKSCTNRNAWKMLGG